MYDFNASWVIQKGFSNLIKIILKSLSSKLIYFGIWTNSISSGMNQRLDAHVSKQLMEGEELDIYFLLQLEPHVNLEDLFYTKLKWKCTILDRTRSFEVLDFGMNSGSGT